MIIGLRYSLEEVTILIRILLFNSRKCLSTLSSKKWTNTSRVHPILTTLLNVINSNIDYDQWGYLLKIAYMHFLSPVPQWILDVQQAYHSEKTANKKGKETRDKLDKPEGVIKEL